MAGRSTIDDVARAAGVSVATVDRVLNGRAKVREETARKVSEAAEAVGYHAATAIRARALAHIPELHLGIVLQKERHAFYQDFAARLEEAARHDPLHRWRLTIRFSPGQSHQDFADTIAGLAGKVQAVAATGVDHHDVTAVVSMLRSRGTPVFALLSDFAAGIRENYLGTNNLKTGRTAAWLMHRIMTHQGKIALFIGGHRFHGHDLREAGFRAYFREYAPGYTFLDTMPNLETRQLTYETTLAILARNPDLSGIYCAGGGMEGAISALQEARLGDRVALIVHELTPESRQGLLQGNVSVVLATPLQPLAQELLSSVAHVLEHGMAENPRQRFIAPLVVTPESI
ncbi:LacI family DNA-binding transcriptional regulator [Paracoccus laeviglucosivorans]|uniref:Transcriptional regulator, LacI family n=1 Tax=Paracoccus laeviglucosivorans TaxID=1197861 RepID=A0A521B7W1_9RHOB|nr:LacI family DNA-binding transcriptional regulator [Paracoccus laeviglucosivorans]SMO43192.1 transcriptional regulator, LacI family [Paracoccus laeviglucosivorans]